MKNTLLISAVLVVAATLSASPAHAGVQMQVSAPNCVASADSLGLMFFSSNSVGFGSGKYGTITLSCLVDPAKWTYRDVASMTVTYLDGDLGNGGTGSANVDVSLHQINKSTGADTVVSRSGSDFSFHSSNYWYAGVKELSIVPGPLALDVDNNYYYLKVSITRSSSQTSTTELLYGVALNY